MKDQGDFPLNSSSGIEEEGNPKWNPEQAPF
jgi:hypothetical protein